MSRKADSLLADMLDNRWSYSDTKTNATLTAAIVAAPGGSKDCRHMDFFYLSVLNKNTLNTTMTVSVRDISIAGTVLAVFPFLVGASQVAQVSISDIHLMATPGAGIFVTTDTVAPSVTATCNASGWTDQATHY